MKEGRKSYSFTVLLKICYLKIPFYIEKKNTNLTFILLKKGCNSVMKL